MITTLPIVIVGAGPYGLSIAAHLRATGADFRAFGVPMHSWRHSMPAGMLLKSEGFASDLYAPETGFTFEQYCQERGLPYAPIGLPPSVETIAAYGMAFQERRVPGLEQKHVATIERAPEGFTVRLDDGEAITARGVVVATGISHFAYVPPVLAKLPAALVSHSSAHHDLTGFAGRDVAVLGAGSSAIDLAVLLHKAGARVRLVARVPSLFFHERADTGPRSLWRRVRYPMSGLGAGPRSRFYADFPGLFHHLPERLRHRAVGSALGPAGGWFMKDEIIGKVPLALGWSAESADERGGRAQLRFRDAAGRTQELTADHVIAATGYRSDLAKLPFLSEELRAAIRLSAGTPVLSRNFESSVPGLYFAGMIAANCFGPVMRFMIGARFTAHSVAHHLAASSQGSARPFPKPGYVS